MQALLSADSHDPQLDENGEEEETDATVETCFIRPELAPEVITQSRGQRPAVTRNADEPLRPGVSPLDATEMSVMPISAPNAGTFAVFSLEKGEESVDVFNFDNQWYKLRCITFNVNNRQSSHIVSIRLTTINVINTI